MHVNGSSHFRQKTQPYLIKGEDYFWQIDVTEPIQAATYSLIYSRQINPKWAWSVGIPYNPKGFKLKGTFNDPTESIVRVYENRVIIPYIGVLGGVRYTFFDKNAWKLNVETFINPEIEAVGSQGLRKIGISSMASLNIEKAFSPHFSAILNPFFETALMCYTKSSSFRYSPLGYGVMFGVKMQ
jgi:hypothetical protein